MLTKFNTDLHLLYFFWFWNSRGNHSRSSAGRSWVLTDVLILHCWTLLVSWTYLVWPVENLLRFSTVKTLKKSWQFAPIPISLYSISDKFTLQAHLPPLLQRQRNWTILYREVSGEKKLPRKVREALYIEKERMQSYHK